MKIISRLLRFLIVAGTLTSCMEDDWPWQVKNLDTPPEGVFILNEGNFMYGNASLTYYAIQGKEAFQDVFSTVNGMPLGDVAHSMTIRDSLGYIVVNNSGRIVVININSFAYVGKITGLTSPRYIHFVNDNKAYVTDLYARAISIVDPRILKVTGRIEVSNRNNHLYQHSTEQMVRVGKEVFVSCWSFDNTILVIDTASNRVTDSIRVLLQPVAMVADANNKLWVLCDGGGTGNPAGFETPGLMRIDASTRQVERIIYFNPADKPVDLVINGRGDTLYFINNHVYRLPAESDADPEVFIGSGTKSGNAGYCAIGIDPFTSDIYVADGIDYVQRGLIFRYSTLGVPVDTFRAGIIPGFFCFKPINPIEP